MLDLTLHPTEKANNQVIYLKNRGNCGPPHKKNIESISDSMRVLLLTVENAASVLVSYWLLSKSQRSWHWCLFYIFDSGVWVVVGG